MLKFAVKAISQCEELKSSKVLEVFETELKALEFANIERQNYWNLRVGKYCTKCDKFLSECNCY